MTFWQHWRYSCQHNFPFRNFRNFFTDWRREIITCSCWFSVTTGFVVATKLLEEVSAGSSARADSVALLSSKIKGNCWYNTKGTGLKLLLTSINAPRAEVLKYNVFMVISLFKRSVKVVSVVPLPSVSAICRFISTCKKFFNRNGEINFLLSIKLFHYKIWSCQSWIIAFVILNLIFLEINGLRTVLRQLILTKSPLIRSRAQGLRKSSFRDRRL